MMLAAVLVALAPPLGWALPVDQPVEVVATYGPDGGSPRHKGTDDPQRNNDHYAVDLAPIGADPLPVRTPVAGTVVRLGWSKHAWSGYGRFVVVRSGDLYATYAHLRSVAPDLALGSELAAGHVLGVVGRSCGGVDACPRFSRDHLHWVVHRDCKLGPAPWGGCYAGEAVPMLGEAGPDRGAVLRPGRQRARGARTAQTVDGARVAPVRDRPPAAAAPDHR